MKEGEKDIYRMARIRERKTRDINQIKCIKDGVDRLLVRDEEIKDRWREYFDKLFNGEEEGPILELDDSFDDNNRRFVRRIQEAEIEQALKRMKSGKAIGPDEGYKDREDHTIGNILRMQLHRDPNVLFAGYKLPHPLQYKIIVRIHTTSQTSPTQAYTTIDDLDKELEYLKQAFEASQSSTMHIQAQPLPYPEFIMSNQPTPRPVPPTTATKEGKSRMRKGKDGTDADNKTGGPKKTAVAKKT
ncbi:hypothetical protein PR202_gb12702 [Eleusine coracana subsp. coracana]|uniref:DNA-directed RNA polymerase RBP11-like dimerisation domain-containing protein n=1 Tax=Eleusine coracana subsp. coracana TaxID=191504 RepID=A0AAV5ENN2_ELECO|nr:hypothetical protein PR202_gb12702 [Eleusine coracana subsp. coracana]